MLLNKELNPAFHTSRPVFELVFNGAHCRAGKRADKPSSCVGIFDSQSVKTVSKGAAMTQAPGRHTMGLLLAVVVPSAGIQDRGVWFAANPKLDALLGSAPTIAPCFFFFHQPRRWTTKPRSRPACRTRCRSLRRRRRS